MALSETWDAAPVEASAAQDRVELLVGGARCAGCIQKIESAVRARAGVTSARLNLTTG